MKAIRSKVITIGMLFALMFGHSVYAAEDFFWSDVEPRPSCVSVNREGTTNKMYLKTDGKTIDLNLPSCDVAMKSYVKVQVEGKYLHVIGGSSGEPFIENGRTMIPLRAIADAFNFEVKWEQSDAKITLTKDGKNIILYIGKSEMLVDGNKVSLEGTAPVIRDHVTFLPVKQLAEALNLKVGWNSEKRTATFTQD